MKKFIFYLNKKATKVIRQSKKLSKKVQLLKKKAFIFQKFQLKKKQKTYVIENRAVVPSLVGV